MSPGELGHFEAFKFAFKMCVSAFWEITEDVPEFLCHLSATHCLALSTLAFSTSWYGPFCLNNDISMLLLMQMEISDAADMLCTFFEIYKRCGGRVLKFICDSL